MSSESRPVVHYRQWDDGFSVRSMTKADAKIVQKWYCEICPTACDLDVAMDSLPVDIRHGFYVGEYQGRVVASVMRIPVAEGIYYGSYYYVEKEFRRMGFGRRINFEVAAEYVGSNVLAIDAHDNLEEANKRHGFQTAYKVLMYSGRPRWQNDGEEGGGGIHVKDVSAYTDGSSYRA